MKSEVLEYRKLNERYAAPLPDDGSDLLELRFLDRLPGFCHNISLAKYMDEKLRQIETQRFSNRGFASPSKRTRVDWNDISSSSFVLTKGFPIYCSDASEGSGGSVTVFARGRKIRLDEPELVTDLVRDLNAGKTVVPRNWQSGVESKGYVMGALFKFLYEARAIEPLSQDSN